MPYIVRDAARPNQKHCHITRLRSKMAMFLVDTDRLRAVPDPEIEIMADIRSSDAGRMDDGNAGHPPYSYSQEALNNGLYEAR